MNTDQKEITVNLSDKEYNRIFNDPFKEVKAFGGSWFVKCLECKPSDYASTGCWYKYYATYVQIPITG
jgi:hypothetical protein